MKVQERRSAFFAADRISGAIIAVFVPGE